MIGIAWGLGWLQGSETERRYQTPAAYQASAKADAERVCGAGPGAFDCIYEKVEAAKEQASTEQDLSAQQRAANSALASAVISFLTLVVTAIGVVFVKSTLDATWKAVDDTGNATEAMLEANKIAYDAYRPWIFVKSVSVNPQDWRSRGERFEWVIQLQNKGASPALIDAVEYRLCLTNGIPSEPFMDDDSPHGLAIKRRRFMDHFMTTGPIEPIEANGSSAPILFNGGTILTRRKPLPEEWKARTEEIFQKTIPVEGFLAWWLQGRVRYRDARNRECETAFCFKCDMGWGAMTEEGGTKHNYRI
ncbi:hypothetical protein KK488_06540 [Sphingobium sp. H33]|uniref:Uncharacterized protein n=1 Tax=Sphingobium nicotianae TaxID=2782607 RepID=A0A9X1DAY8_9SPHN|nr:hypothetical protein [Sphingobium nicotianae]